MAKEYWYLASMVLAVVLPLALLFAVKKLHLLETWPDQIIVYKVVNQQSLSLHAFKAQNRPDDAPSPAGGEIQGKDRPLAGAAHHLDAAAVFEKNILRNVHPQPRPLTFPLGGEERFENFRETFSRDTRSLVSDPDKHPVVGIDGHRDLRGIRALPLLGVARWRERGRWARARRE